MVLGRGTMLKDFETPLHGLSAGAETEFDLTFPADYGSAEIAGKAARFHVRLHAVEELTLPEVDDEFAAAFDVQEGGINCVAPVIAREYGTQARWYQKPGQAPGDAGLAES